MSVSIGLQSSTISEEFVINATTGVIRTTQPLDREMRSIHILHVAVTSRGKVKRQAVVNKHRKNRMPNEFQTVTNGAPGIDLAKLYDISDNECLVFVQVRFSLSLFSQTLSKVRDLNDNAPTFRAPEYGLVYVIQPNTKDGTEIAKLQVLKLALSSRFMSHSHTGGRLGHEYHAHVWHSSTR